MEFTTSKYSYSVADIFEMFRARLPVVVMVTQGFYGDIAEDTFDIGQVLTINAISRQKRVTGTLQIFGKQRLISLPVNYKEKLCIIHKGKAGHEDHLHRILEQNSLPIMVQFPRDRVLTLGNRSLNTNNIPPIDLNMRFDEVYLLGHTIIEGEANVNINYVPLYLTYLRLSPINGIKGSSAETWKTFFDNLKHVSSRIQYDQTLGNPDIAEYDPKAVHNEARFTYVQPRSYSSIVELMDGGPLRTRPRLRFISKISEENKKQGARRVRPLPPLPRTHTSEDRSDTDRDNTAELTDDSYLIPMSRSRETVPGKDISTLKVLDFENARISSKGRETPEPDYFDDRPPFIQERKAPSGDNSKEYKQQENSPTYSNDIPRTYVTPVLRTPQVSTMDSTFRIGQNKTRNQKTEITHNQKVNNVSELSIDEVCAYLEVLNLDKYTECFRANLVDGELLTALNESILREEFGMKRIEVLRLLKFAKEGYIPL